MVPCDAGDQPVIGQYEPLFGQPGGDQPAIDSHPRIDHRQVNRPARKRINDPGKHERPLEDVLRRDRVTDIDNLRFRGQAEQYALHGRHVRTADAEVRGQGQDSRFHGTASFLAPRSDRSRFPAWELTCGARSTPCRLVSCRDPRADSPPRIELADDLHPNRLARGDQVVQDGVDRVLVKDAAITIAEEIKLQALQLQTRCRRYVGDHDRAEIGLPGLGADRGELRTGDLDLVLSIRETDWETTPPRKAYRALIVLWSIRERHFAWSCQDQSPLAQALNCYSIHGFPRA